MPGPSPIAPTNSTSATISSSEKRTGDRRACRFGAAIGIRPVRNAKSAAASPSSVSAGPRLATPWPRAPWQAAQWAA
jgi:hypothetical protein